MISHLRSLAVIVLAGASAFTAAACGDDSVNPSNPDASAAKDAAGEGGEGDAASGAGEAGGEGGAEAGNDAGGEGGDAASD